MKYLAMVLGAVTLGVTLYTMFVDDKILRYIMDDVIPSIADFLRGINIGYY